MNLKAFTNHDRAKQKLHHRWSLILNSVACSYVKDIWSRRYFCLHLTLSDIRSRFRRSHLGLAWAIFQPMLLTTIMSVVLAVVFKQPYKEFSLYVFSGIITWELIVGSINTGAASIIGGEGYLRQVRMPILIFPIKAVLFCIVFYFCGLFGYFIYAAFVLPASLSLYAIALLPITLLLFAFCLPLATISAIINTHFRDFLQVTSLLLQIVWYLSPVFVARDVFNRPYLRQWDAINPVASICDVIRNPLIYHTMPAADDILLIIIYTVFLWVLASALVYRYQARIVFYL
jgi:lipopolysaccharide transport system permease protein